MSFQWSEKHLVEFFQDGITVFRGILPPALVADLRRATADVARLAREKSGPQAQRLQPVGAYDLPARPFRDYAELPALREAVAAVLSPEHDYGRPDTLGLLIEPSEQPWCTVWHRDFRDHVTPEVFEREFKADWDRQVMDLAFLNQVNCALYQDGSTWFVPGSHFRQRNTAAEERAANAFDGVDLSNRDSRRTPEEQERHCLAYCEGMPGAMQLHLNAGDFALYRPCAWHLGNYVPYRRRMTLHDSVLTPAGQAVWSRTMERWNQIRTQTKI